MSLTYRFATIPAVILIAIQSALAGGIDPVLEWSWTSSVDVPTALNVMMTPSVIDLDGDSIPEIVFGSTASAGGGLVEIGFLRAIRGTDGSDVFTVTDLDLRVNTACNIATGNIDSEPLPEILACDATGARIIAFENDGTFKWRSGTLETINWGSIAIANLDGVGDPEIIVGRQVLDSDGVLLWTGTGGRGSQANVGPMATVADIDLDGVVEVIAGNTVYDNAGNIEWTAQVNDGYPAVANFDDDDFAEVVIVTAGSVWLVDHDGTTIWGPSAIPGGGAGGPPTVADYDADGQPEIGVAGAVRYAVFETDGTLKWQAVTQDGSSNRTGSSVFDFDGDGAAEVVYSDETKLWVYAGTTGATLFETALSSCTWHEYPLVADIDGDDAAELLAVANNNCGFGTQRGVYAYGSASDAWVLTRRIWNQHTYHITNVNPDGSIPLVQQNNWQVDGLNNFRLNEFGSDEGPICDVDRNGQVDRIDIKAIFNARNTPAVVGDARDFDGDGFITVLDARGCVGECTFAECAQQVTSRPPVRGKGE